MENIGKRILDSHVCSSLIFSLSPTNVIESLANIVRKIKVEKRLIKCEDFAIVLKSWKKFLIKLRLNGSAKLNLYMQKQK